MWEEKRLGVIRQVNSSSVEVIVDPQVTSLVKKIGNKTYQIGQIGTYVLIPTGKLYIIGLVSEFKKADVYENEKVVQRFLMTVVLAGTLRQGRFETGVSLLPTADMPVYLLEDKDLKAAFSSYQRFGFSVGRLSSFEDERAFLDPNKFFGKHIAVLGSTGSGKSCTVSSILQKVVAYPDAHVVLLDIHNEYKKALPNDSRYFDIAGLELPYWLMNFEELVEVLIDPRDENAGTQISVLQDLIFAAKKEKNPGLAEVITVDTPVFYGLQEVRSKLQFLDTEKITIAGTSREGPNYGKFNKLLVRLNSMFNDPRYRFMFKLRVCTDTQSIKALLPMIFALDGKAKVTIMDMSGVPFDIVNTVAALIARVAFDFNFWNPNRRELPILLVFEEAHNYLSTSNEGSKAARRTVERIAKEGRKYGVSCMIVSQRPAEISETILSQCNNFLILRLLNPVDQTYIRRLVPESFNGLENAIPTLRQGEVVIVGDAAPMPMRVQIDPPTPPPESSDISFFEQWKQKSSATNVAEVIERWWHQQRSWE